MWGDFDQAWAISTKLGEWAISTNFGEISIAILTNFGHVRQIYLDLALATCRTLSPAKISVAGSRLIFSPVNILAGGVLRGDRGKARLAGNLARVPAGRIWPFAGPVLQKGHKIALLELGLRCRRLWPFMAGTIK